MARRVTIMVDNDLDKKLRDLQAKRIIESEGAYSYSSAINEVLGKVVR